jgi:hypothetical protein
MGYQCQRLRKWVRKTRYIFSLKATSLPLSGSYVGCSLLFRVFLINQCIHVIIRPGQQCPARTFDSPEELEKRNAEEIARNPDGVLRPALLLMFVNCELPA